MTYHLQFRQKAIFNLNRPDTWGTATEDDDRTPLVFATKAEAKEWAALFGYIDCEYKVVKAAK